MKSLITVFLLLLFALFTIKLPGQDIERLDSSKVIAIKSTNSIFSKKDDGVHAFRYLFGKTMQNKSSYLKFAERFLYSTSFVWIPTQGYYKENWLHEFTWYNSLSLNINKSIYVGIHYLMIFTKGSVIYNESPIENYNVYGLVFQYDFLPRFENRLFIETSINKGNYCTRSDDDPYKLSDLSYWGLGIGYDFPLYKRVSFRVGFTNYSILNKVKDKTNFTQYVLGLNVNLGKNSYRPDISFLSIFN